MRFFDKYPEFYVLFQDVKADKKRQAHDYNPNRMHQRYMSIIDWNLKYIEGCKILDIGAHDGRWSFAAAKLGAKQCVMVEPRHELCKIANSHFNNNGIGEKLVCHTKTYQEYKSGTNEKFDTILCLGYLYHTLDNFKLLSDMLEQSSVIILDTQVSLHDHLINRTDNTKHIMSAFDEIHVSTPSKSAMDRFLKERGCNVEYYDWKTHCSDFTSCDDYAGGVRVTMRVTRI